MQFLRRLFLRKKETKNVSNKQVKQINLDDFKGMSNREKVKQACKEYDAISTPFTSNMIYSYLGGLVSPENTYKQIHALYKLGFLKKVTVLCSDPEKNRLKHFYELQK